MRLILHVDLDAFYASCEEVRQPTLRGKPLVMCMFSGREGSGAVATASYPARALGIRAGQALRVARAKASPETVFLPADRPFYKQVSDRIMALLRERADAFEQRSIDEAYLDVSSSGSVAAATKLAQELKNAVRSQEHLTCTVGVGPNKLVAKMACRERKPDGLTVVLPDQAREFLGPKPVEKLFGIGPKTLPALQRLGIATIGDLAAADPAALQQALGSTKAALLQQHARGEDPSPVQPVDQQQRSRIGTLAADTRDPLILQEKLTALTTDLFRSPPPPFRTVTLILISSRMEMLTRSVTLPQPIQEASAVLKIAASLLPAALDDLSGAVRRVGIRVSGFPRETPQRSLGDFKGAPRKTGE